MKSKRPDVDGNEQGLYKHNRAILRKVAEVCALCGRPLDKSRRFPDPLSTSIDHIIPVTAGGRSTMDNLQATHLICNQQKGGKIVLRTKTPADARESHPPIPQYFDWSSF